MSANIPAPITAARDEVARQTCIWEQSVDRCAPEALIRANYDAMKAARANLRTVVRACQQGTL